MRGVALFVALAVAAVLLTPLASAVPRMGAAPAPLSGPGWTATSVCGATTSGGIVMPGPSCSPNPPDVPGPLPGQGGAIYAGSPGTGQFVFWAPTGGKCNAYLTCQVTWEYDNGTGKWVNDTAGTGSVHPAPASGWGGCMAWDPVGSYFLAVSASTSGVNHDAWTWKFASHVWTNASVSFLGDWGGDCAMAWDYASSEAVLYFQDSAYKGGLTYVWAGSTWANVTAASGTAAMGCIDGNIMAWDAPGNEVVSFGGYPCATATSEHWTWAYSGTSWTNLTASAGTPTGTVNTEEDEIAGVSSGVFLMTAGASLTSAPQFWELNGTWSAEAVSGSSGVCQRQGGLMGPVGTSRAFLFGGDPIANGGPAPCNTGGAGGFFNDSWSFTASGSSDGPSAPGNGSVGHPIALTCSSVVLSWSNGPAPSGTTLVNVTVYVYQGTSNDTAPVQVISTNGAISSLQVNGLNCNSRYVFQVRDWYSNGSPGPVSGVFQFATDGSLTSSPTTCTSCMSAAPPSWWALLVIVLVASVAAVLLFVRLTGHRRGGREVG